MITCKCGSKEFHTFYKHIVKNVERMICNNCDRTYEVKDGVKKEIDLDKLWKEALAKERK